MSPSFALGRPRARPGPPVPCIVSTLPVVFYNSLTVFAWGFFTYSVSYYPLPGDRVLRVCLPACLPACPQRDGRGRIHPVAVSSTAAWIGEPTSSESLDKVLCDLRERRFRRSHWSKYSPSLCGHTFCRPHTHPPMTSPDVKTNTGGRRDAAALMRHPRC